MTALTWLGDGVIAIILVLCLPVVVLIVGLPFMLLVQGLLALADRL